MVLRAISSKVQLTAGRDFVEAAGDSHAVRARLHRGLVAAGAVSEATVLKTDIFRAILEDAVDEAGSVALLPARCHRLGPGAGDEDSAGVAGRAASVLRTITNQAQPTAARGSRAVVVVAGNTVMVRKATGSKGRLMVGQDFVGDVGGQADRTDLHRWQVVAGADSEATVLKTDIFRAILEDAVDEAGSVAHLPARRHRPGVARGSRAAVVAVARAGTVRRGITRKGVVGAGKITFSHRRPGLGSEAGEAGGAVLRR
jgi:hypothetical protein